MRRPWIPVSRTALACACRCWDPLENADMVGLDLTLDIHNTIIPELDRSAGPNLHLERALVAAGEA